MLLTGCNGEDIEYTAANVGSSEGIEYVYHEDDVYDEYEINESTTYDENELQNDHAFVDYNPDTGARLSVNGIITGDVIFHGIEASRLFKEPFIEILGPPKNQEGFFIFYEGFQLVAHGWVWTDDDERTIIYIGSGGSIGFTDFSLPSINNVGFHSGMTHEDVIAVLGNHLQYYEYYDWQNNTPYRDDLMSYRIANSEIEYQLEFWFRDDGLDLITIRFFWDDVNGYAGEASREISWQEAYTKTLRLYARQDLQEWEENWKFALHDINQNGIPELFIGVEWSSGHFEYRYVYTFLDGVGAIRLDFQGFVTDGAIFFLADRPGIVAFLAFAGGGHYIKHEMLDLGLVPIVEGMAFMSDEGHEMMHLYEDFDWRNYEWYVLTIEGNSVSVEEFENAFGSRDDRTWPVFHEVNDDNIMQVIPGF